MPPCHNDADPAQTRLAIPDVSAYVTDTVLPPASRYRKTEDPQATLSKLWCANRHTNLGPMVLRAGLILGGRVSL